MQRSVHFDICPFGTRACYMGSKKRSKQFKINGLGCFGEACFEGPIWTIQIAKSFPCSAALVFFFAEALPCSAALILQLLMFLVVPHVGPSERVRNVMKWMAFWWFSTWRAHWERPPNASRRSILAKYVRKNNVLCDCLGSSLASTWGSPFFGVRNSGAPMDLQQTSKTS